MKRNIIYLDTEFCNFEGRLELISIGLVKATGECYYAISSEFNPKNTSEWVRTNVLPFLETNIRRKTVAEIAEEIPVFVGHQVADIWGYLCMRDWQLIVQMYGDDLQKIPYNLPIYCKELLQEIDRQKFPTHTLPARTKVHHALHDAEWGRQVGGLLGIHGF